MFVFEHVGKSRKVEYSEQMEFMDEEKECNKFDFRSSNNNRNKPVEKFMVTPKVCVTYLKRRIVASAQGQNNKVGHQEDHHELLHEFGSRIQNSIEFFVEGRDQESRCQETATRKGRREGNSLRLEEALDEHVREDKEG